MSLKVSHNPNNIDTDSNVPWHHTENMANARKTLVTMYSDESGQVSKVLKTFIEKNCLHLTKPPVGDTGISKGYFHSDNWTTKTKYPMGANGIDSELVNTLPSKAGVYSIYSLQSCKFAIGSTTDFNTRFDNHYADSTNPKLSNRLLYAEAAIGGWNQFVWHPTVCISNYYLEFIKDHPSYSSDYTTFRILQTFTQYEARMYEQAFQTYCKHELNGPGDVTFTITWDPNDIRPSKLGDRPFTAITQRGNSFEFWSQNQGRKVLGTSRKTISTVINYETVYVECPNLGVKARFVGSQMPLKSGNPYKNPYLAPDLKGLDYDKLPIRGIHAFTESFQLHSVYATRTDAAQKCGFDGKYYRVSRYINKRFLNCVVNKTPIKLMFAQNPLWKKGQKAVLCKDTSTNISVQYSSVNDCARAIGAVDPSGLIKNYIRPEKKYGKYIISYVKPQS